MWKLSCFFLRDSYDPFKAYLITLREMANINRKGKGKTDREEGRLGAYCVWVSFTIVSSILWKAALLYYHRTILKIPEIHDVSILNKSDFVACSDGDILILDKTNSTIVTWEYLISPVLKESKIRDWFPQMFSKELN